MATNLPVWGTIVLSWKKTHGVRGSFWTAVGIMFAITLVLGIIEGFIPPLAALASFFSSLAGFLLRAGMTYMGILRANDAPVNYQQTFRAMNFHLGWKVVAVGVLQVIAYIPCMAIIYVGAVIAQVQFWLGVFIGAIGVLSGVYIMLRLAFGICYVVDKGIGPWQAIKLSFKVTRGHLWSLIGIFALFFILLAISALPLGIGLIWTLPCGFVLYGVVYQKLASQG